MLASLNFPNGKILTYSKLTTTGTYVPGKVVAADTVTPAAEKISRFAAVYRRPAATGRVGLRSTEISDITQFPASGNVQR